MRIKAIVALVSLSPLLIGASEPLRLQPATPWGVDYAENSCRLVRTFGQGDDQTQVVLESIAPGQMSMMAIGNHAMAGIADDLPVHTHAPVEDRRDRLGSREQSQLRQRARQGHRV